MGYYIDLSSISLDQYKEKLLSATLVPSRMILRENIDEIFLLLKDQGINNVLELQTALKKKEMLAELVRIGCLSEEYLKNLNREVNSMQPKPNKLKDFIGINEEVISKLEKAGIKNTLRLYENVMTRIERKDFSKQIGIAEDTVLELTKLADLSRIKWVGNTFARVLYDAGYDTIEKIIKADHEELYNNIKKLNEKRKLYSGHIGIKDMKVLIEVAKDVPLEIEY